MSFASIPQCSENKEQVRFRKILPPVTSRNSHSNVMSLLGICFVMLFSRVLSQALIVYHCVSGMDLSIQKKIAHQVHRLFIKFLGQSYSQVLTEVHAFVCAEPDCKVSAPHIYHRKTDVSLTGSKCTGSIVGLCARFMRGNAQLYWKLQVRFPRMCGLPTEFCNSVIYQCFTKS